MPLGIFRRSVDGRTRADARISSRTATYLLSSVVTSLISFVTLPLATRILGPANYGVFAFGATVASFGATLATLGTSFFVANRFSEAEPQERRSLITTLTLRAAVLATAWAVFVLAGAFALRGEVELLDEVPLRGLALVLVGAALATTWTIAVDVLTVEGRASWFALTLIVQAIANASVLLIALYAFDLGGLALFVGSFAGSAAVFATSILVLRPYLAWPPPKRYERLGQRRFLPAQALDAVHPVVERILLASYAGFTQLGNYAHSVAYRALFLQGMNAVNRATWPVTLAEAREQGRFFVTGRVWAAMHLGTTMVAVPFVLFGDRLIAALTNDKLTPAWVFLAPWFVLVLLQSSGKAATGIVYALHESHVVARLGFVSNAVAIASVAVLVPLVGAPGAAGALLLQALVFRIALQVVVRRRTSIPFQDLGVLAGCALVTLLFFLRRHAFDSTEGLLVLLAAAELACVAVGGRVIATTLVPLVLRLRARSA